MSKQSWTDLDDEDLRWYLSFGERPLKLLSELDVPQWNAHLKNHASTALAYTQIYSQKKQGVSVHFAPTSYSEINGTAKCHHVDGQEYRFATITAGSFLYLHRFFQYIMSRRDLLLHIGDPAKGPNPLAHFTPSGQYPFLGPFRPDEIVAKGSTGYSECPIRADFAGAMESAASLFLIFHEIGHCTNGHLQVAQFNAFEADNKVVEDTSHTLIRHTLEMDADSAGTNFIFHHVLADLGINAAFTWSPELKKFPAGKLLYPALIGVNLLFRVLARPELLASKFADMLTGTHPHPGIRMNLCASNLVELSYKRGIDSENRRWVAELAVKAASESAQIWSGLTGTPEDSKFRRFTDENGKHGFDEVRRYLIELLECWSVLRPTLQARALIVLAPSWRDSEK